MKKIIKYLYLILLLNLAFLPMVNAQRVSYKRKVINFKKVWPPVINKLSELELPETMMEDIRVFSRADFKNGWAEDYHQNVIEDGTEYVIKIMLRFIDGNIVGYIKKEPLYRTLESEYFQTQIDIHLEWCALDSLGQKHCGKTPEELAELNKVTPPENWFQKLDVKEQVKVTLQANAELLNMLETKNGRKKIIGKELGDSVSHVISLLSKEDSIYFAAKVDLMNREKLIKKGNREIIMDDSTLILSSSNINPKKNITKSTNKTKK